MNIERTIFKNGSTTYYFSSKFFPKGVRDDVFKLYSFVRIVDDMIDTVPADTDAFNKMCARWKTVRKQLQRGEVPKALDGSVEERVLANIAYIVHRYGCDPDWVDAFLLSMRWDTEGKTYTTLSDTLAYIYGSAEVIGLFMCKIMRLPDDAYEAAKMQGRAMQFINFLRDIDEDNTLGRTYVPSVELKKYGLTDLREESARSNPEGFKKCVQFQLDRYEMWQDKANKGLLFIPRRLRVPLQTAIDMYNWTAEQIHGDPFVIYDHKVKPRKRRVMTRAVRRSLWNK